MKNIITSTNPEKEILASDLPEYPLIGAYSIHNPTKKSFVVMTRYFDPHSYYLMTRDSFEHGNGYGTSAKDPYFGTIEKILQHSSLKFVLFDSAQELFKWLSE